MMPIAAVGAGDGEAAVREFDVAFGRLQQMRGGLLALCDRRAAQASTIAVPVAVIEREPPVPSPERTRSLSPCTSVIVSKGTPSCADSTWANGVAWPWP